jgi:hypothetical protein
MKAMLPVIAIAALLAAMIGCVEVQEDAFSNVKHAEGKVYIYDQTGAKWDVTQAVSLGFVPEKFQYGMGKDFFTPLDDSQLSESVADVSENLRIIGVVEGGESQAYSVPRLSRHEISNNTIQGKPVAVGY